MTDATYWDTRYAESTAVWSGNANLALVTGFSLHEDRHEAIRRGLDWMATRGLGPAPLGDGGG